jgi:hypothetical protein
VPVVLFATEPFVDLARLELSAAGVSELRVVVFGPVLGDRTAAQVVERATEMASELEAMLAGA